MSNGWQVQGIIARAGDQGSGIVFEAETLKGMADNKRLFWDEKLQALIYKGPGVRGGDLPKLQL